MLRGWDYRWSGLRRPIARDGLGRGADEGAQRAQVGAGNKIMMRPASATPRGQKLRALAAASARLQRDFGRWQVPWGEINRFQRISPAIIPPFSDNAPSIPVAFAEGS